MNDADHKDRIWLYVTSLLLLALTSYVIFSAHQPEWKLYQTEFVELVTQRFGAARARGLQLGLRQIYVPELKVADRCVTCHLGVEWKGLENAPEPFRTHPREILDKHPLARYGCTPCHGGQGYATTMAEAHAVGLPHWREPLLGRELAQVYSIRESQALFQMRCNFCHRYDRATPGAELINYGKELVRQKGCRACHKIHGRGGVIGPDLTYEGDKSPEQYNYERLLGTPSVFGWHLAHFKDPKSMSADSVMPNFGFGSREALALTLLVMSWRRVELPPSYLPGVEIGETPTPEELEREQRMLTGPGGFFVRKGCFVCHDVSSLGVESAAKIGPDLADAFADVQSRFGMTLENFLAQPTGTMSVVLATQIQLTDEEKTEVVELLRKAYELKHGPLGR